MNNPPSSLSPLDSWAGLQDMAQALWPAITSPFHLTLHLSCSGGHVPEANFLSLPALLPPYP